MSPVHPSHQCTGINLPNLYYWQSCMAVLRQKHALGKFFSTFPEHLDVLPFLALSPWVRFLILYQFKNNTSIIKKF